MKLIAIAVAASLLPTVPAAAQFYKHEDGVSYEMISKCLHEEFGFDEGRHFRKKPGSEGTVQWNKANLVGDGYAKFVPESEKCWKKQAHEAEEEEKPSPRKK